MFYSVDVLFFFILKTVLIDLSSLIRFRSTRIRFFPNRTRKKLTVTNRGQTRLILLTIYEPRLSFSTAVEIFEFF